MHCAGAGAQRAKTAQLPWARIYLFNRLPTNWPPAFRQARNGGRQVGPSAKSDAWMLRLRDPLQQYDAFYPVENTRITQLCWSRQGFQGFDCWGAQRHAAGRG